MRNVICSAFLLVTFSGVLSVDAAQAQETTPFRDAAVPLRLNITADGDIRPIPEPEPDPLDVVSISRELASVEDLFSDRSGAPVGFDPARAKDRGTDPSLIRLAKERVGFDSARAKDRGTDPSVIRLAEELAAYTNDLVRAADDFVNHRSTTNPMDVAASSKKYPMVSRFFHAATAFHPPESRRTLNAGSDSQASGLPPVQTLGWCNWAITDVACTCGHFLNPQPTSTALPKTYKFENPSATLQSWGYHQTPSFAGGGWTRAQTYYPSRCGTGTFRDHAYILADGKSLNEQNYEGWTPRGEPNPEFWTSLVWPYPAWPAYVAWWHCGWNFCVD